LANRRLRKKKERLSSFGQKARGMSERGMREVVIGPLWHYFGQVKKEVLLVLGEKIQSKGVAYFYFW
jgi:hypothetical protein